MPLLAPPPAELLLVFVASGSPPELPQAAVPSSAATVATVTVILVSLTGGASRFGRQVVNWLGRPRYAAARESLHPGGYFLAGRAGAAPGARHPFLVR